METTDTLDRGNIRGRRERSGNSNGQEDLFAAQAAASNNESNNVCADDFNKAYNQLQDILLKAATIQASVATLNIGDEYKMYYDRVVRPALDIIYFLSFAIQNTAAAANLYQANTYGKKGEGKKALDISYEMLEQMEVGICLLKESLKVLVEKGNCL
ncbi:hypothetical protein PTM93_03000 [Clostridium perfringens]|uniref:Uncharacterized protein n=1 Tax=Clostridium perfringens TaxID=1502 RepID=A0A8H9QWG1_CLOPF|nr:hypothetical protein [Clostridium perfringens]AQW27503.1 hypothetical protein BXT94_12180 [Clostridium perfringens]ATD47920.1 hypothetical protein CMR01_03885 [Clostridium perfringens]EGT5618077.1 hypothetical protein [Clostridium perfringens]EHK2427121.1 hypothetical protein [Clostridium perfringens]EHK2440289.1 hypothetical protein [Clostridium perfringens]